MSRRRSIASSRSLICISYLSLRDFSASFFSSSTCVRLFFSSSRSFSTELIASLIASFCVTSNASSFAFKSWISASFCAADSCNSFESLASANFEVVLLSCFALSSSFASASRSFSTALKASVIASFCATSPASSFAFNSWISVSFAAEAFCISLLICSLASSIVVRLSFSASSSLSCNCWSNSLSRTCFRISAYPDSSILNAFLQCGQMISCISIYILIDKNSLGVPPDVRLPFEHRLYALAYL